MKSPSSPGVYCNPSGSFDGRGSFYNLGDDKFSFIEERIMRVDADEEQGFEAVLDPEHLGRNYDIVIAESSGSFYVPNSTLYGKEKLQRIVRDETRNSTNRRDAVFKMLETMGVKTFIVVSGREDNTVEILQRVRDVIGFVAILRRSEIQKLKCCVLFQDTDGLLYNLVLPREAGGTFEQWQSNMSEFSGIVAMGAVSVLARGFPCIIAGQLENVQPAFWGLLLSLVVWEEMRFSWLNSSLLVQGIPSSSSFVLMNGDSNDWISKVSILCLVFAGATQGNLKQILCMTGASLACITLVANLGSRAWHFLQWRKISLCGPMAPYFAFLLSVFSGLCLPHMGGYRCIENGGKVAVEAVLINAFAVSLLFLLSDCDGIQKHLLGGTEQCGQTVVNIAVGSWIGITLLVNLIVAAHQRRSRPLSKENLHDLILSEDHCSPVGYRVPTFPDFLVEPIRAKRSISFISLEQEIYCALLVAMTMMGVIVSMAFTGWSKTLEQSLISALS